MRRALFFIVLISCGSNSPPGVVVKVDAGTTSQDAGIVTSQPPPWSWVPIEGSMCASGARAGIAINGDTTHTEQLVISLEGGGACWNQGTCVPSLLQFGPVCEYGNFCLFDAAGGTKPTASYVTERDPYPADGGGALPNALATLDTTAVFSRLRADNPFRNATFVFMPYCTGDLHSGDATREYAYQYNLGDTPAKYTVHFAGSTNIDAYLAYLRGHFPAVKKIWLVGVSAGGYGATLHFDRVRRAFANASVDLLADSAPYVDSIRWQQWRDTWNMQMPRGCSEGCDAGYSGLIDHVISENSTRRIALLSNDRDGIVSWFFYGGVGLGDIVAPPSATLNANLLHLAARYDQSANAKYFIVPGTDHVLAPTAGVLQPDGGFSPSLRSRDGGISLREWMDAWATESVSWSSTR